ncbi:MAG: hypothetical protein P4L10_11750 [Acidobacteriaceae bacterium]|nr:hypothetical protein [Acidobacteriaceae bacterium]
MALHKIASAIAGILFLAAFIPYIRSILRGETVPAKATWIIWAAIDTITLAGMVITHALNGQIIGAVLGVWIVAILALRRGASGWSQLDIACIAGAAIGLCLMFFSPTYGLLTSLAVLFIGSIPTFVHGYREPEKENKAAWMIYFLSCLFALPAITKWDVQHAAQPLIFFATESVMVYMTWIRPRFTKALTPTP